MSPTKSELAKHVGRRVSFVRNGIRHEGRLITVDADPVAGQRGFAEVELDDLSRPLVRWIELTPVNQETVEVNLSGISPGGVEKTSATLTVDDAARLLRKTGTVPPGVVWDVDTDPPVSPGWPKPDGPRLSEVLRRVDDIADCTCVVSCGDDPATACSLSGESHVHPDDGSGVFGRCPIHPDAPGDL